MAVGNPVEGNDSSCWQQHFLEQRQEAALMHPRNHPLHKRRLTGEIRMIGLLHNDKVLGKEVPSMSKHKTLAALQRLSLQRYTGTTTLPTEEDQAGLVGAERRLISAGPPNA